MEDHRWKEFELRIEAYRYYINTALQTNVFFYAIAGVALGFYLNQTPNVYLAYALLLPILIAAVLGGIFLYAADTQKRAADTIEILRDELNIKRALEDKEQVIQEIPDLELLYILLKIFGWIFFFVGLALIVTPFLKAAPFQWGQCPTNLIVFALIGNVVLIGGGRGSYCFACKHDKEAKELRSKVKEAKELRSKVKADEEPEIPKQPKN